LPISYATSQVFYIYAIYRLYYLFCYFAYGPSSRDVFEAMSVRFIAIPVRDSGYSFARYHAEHS